MPVPGIELSFQRPAVPRATTRADVALFVGLVALRPGATADGPVEIGNWTEFDARFDWRGRPVREGEPGTLPSALGIAVRSFFREGGIRAWIVRCGDPLPLAAASDAPEAAEALRARMIAAVAGPLPEDSDDQPILPGHLGRSRDADPLDATSWCGAAAIFGIGDAAMLLLPDLADLAAGPAEALAPAAPRPGPAEDFRPCAARDPDAPVDVRGRAFAAPRLTRAGYADWSAMIAHALRLLGRPRGPEHRRDVMLIGALPLPARDPALPGGAEEWPTALMATPSTAGTMAAPLALFDADAIGSARLQLGYPWLEGEDGAALPEALHSPEGALAGLLARRALAEGGFRSAAGQALAGAERPRPLIAGSTLARGLAPHSDWLGDRLCLFAETRGRTRLVSDSTAAADRAWRKGGTSRLMGILLRACRHLGADLSFEPAGPALWGRIESEVGQVLEQLRRLGAFAGQSAPDAYRVTCDSTTMSQADRDAGRVRCEVVFHPASPIERIRVLLDLTEPPSLVMGEAA